MQGTMYSMAVTEGDFMSRLATVYEYMAAFLRQSYVACCYSQCPDRRGVCSKGETERPILLKRKTQGGHLLLSSQLGVIFDSSCATAAQAATIEHESDRP
jgi:hypothetical protein